jgi:hypothetical protein
LGIWLSLRLDAFLNLPGREPRSRQNDEKTATAALNGRAVFNRGSLPESPRRCKRRGRFERAYRLYLTIVEMAAAQPFAKLCAWALSSLDTETKANASIHTVTIVAKAIVKGRAFR